MTIFSAILSTVGIILQGMGLLVLSILAWDALTIKYAMWKNERDGR